jgi:nitroimidazol reductase NimA-like FMN-containing flavoprotein (pyridoxamine 5'-phosphate oxidase superfamily)
MPGYGIKDDDEGLLPWQWAAGRLTEARNYFLSTVRPDGRPHVMPVWGVWIEDRFYFSTGKTSVKAKNLAKNPDCVICPDNGEEAVIMEGRASKVRDSVALRKFGRIYQKKYDMNPLAMHEPVYQVRPRVAFGQVEKTFPKTATRWTF